MRWKGYVLYCTVQCHEIVLLNRFDLGSIGTDYVKRFCKLFRFHEDIRILSSSSSLQATSPLKN